MKKFLNNNIFSLLSKISKELDIETPKIIAFESVYSMDGDIAPIRHIA